MTKRSFRIEFMRALELNEYESFFPHEEDAPAYWNDETEFDTDATTNEAIFCDLINLFNDFVTENGFIDVTVVNIYEVPYDGEE